MTNSLQEMITKLTALLAYDYCKVNIYYLPRQFVLFIVAITNYSEIKGLLARLGDNAYKTAKMTQLL